MFIESLSGPAIWILIAIISAAVATWVAALVISCTSKKENEGEVVTALRALVAKFILMLHEGTGWKTLGAVVGLILINTYPDLQDMWRAILSALDITVLTASKTIQNKTIIKSKMDLEYIKALRSEPSGIASSSASGGDIGGVSAGWPPAQPQAQIQPINPVIPPFIDSQPTFVEHDFEIFIHEQIEVMKEWFTRIVTHKAELPTIPKVKDFGAFSEALHKEQRKAEARNEIARQAWSEVFNNNELTGFYAMNPKCDVQVYHRGNQIFDDARDRWTYYWIAMWEYEDAQD